MKKAVLFFLLSIFALCEISAQITVSGIVSDEQGIPIPAANIVEKGTTNGVVADFDGNFSIEIPEGATLVFSSIGYGTVEKAPGSAELNACI